MAGYWRPNRVRIRGGGEQKKVSSDSPEPYPSAESDAFKFHHVRPSHEPDPDAGLYPAWQPDCCMENRDRRRIRGFVDRVSSEDPASYASLWLFIPKNHYDFMALHCSPVRGRSLFIWVEGSLEGECSLSDLGLRVGRSKVRVSMATLRNGLARGTNWVCHFGESEVVSPTLGPPVQAILMLDVHSADAIAELNEFPPSSSAPQGRHLPRYPDSK